MTHAELIAAIDKARPHQENYHQEAVNRTQHCDDLAALAALHQPYARGDRTCHTCQDEWPCPTAQIITDRLHAWGIQ